MLILIHLLNGARSESKSMNQKFLLVQHLNIWQATICFKVPLRSCQSLLSILKLEIEFLIWHQLLEVRLHILLKLWKILGVYLQMIWKKKDSKPCNLTFTDWASRIQSSLAEMAENIHKYFLDPLIEFF